MNDETRESAERIAKRIENPADQVEGEEESRLVFSQEETERRNDGRRYLVIKPPREPGQPQYVYVLPEKDPEPE